jgi:hypothetical protein
VKAALLKSWALTAAPFAPECASSISANPDIFISIVQGWPSLQNRVPGFDFFIFLKKFLANKTEDSPLGKSLVL